MRWAGLGNKRGMGLLIAAMALAACQAIDPVQDGSYRVTQAWTRNELVPQLSADYGKAFTPESAYRIQRTALNSITRAAPRSVTRRH